jgi:hypothetical protein
MTAVAADPMLRTPGAAVILEAHGGCLHVMVSRVLAVAAVDWPTLGDEDRAALLHLADGVIGGVR